MSYINSRDVAQRWGVSQRRVLRLANEGRIPGAKQIGHCWFFPEDCSKPLDARTFEGKAADSEEVFFRFPMFDYMDPASFSPPLSGEELLIKELGEAINACELDRVRRLLDAFPVPPTSRFLHLGFLYYSCIYDIVTASVQSFYEHYGEMKAILQEDFPYKDAAYTIRYSVESLTGLYDHFANSFTVNPDGNYHESYLPSLYTYAVYSVLLSSKPVSRNELLSSELHSLYVDTYGTVTQRVYVHIYLFLTYSELGRSTEALSHAGKALELSEQYNCLFPVAVHYSYFKKLFAHPLKAMPAGYQKRLTEAADLIFNRYLSFTRSMSLSTFYNLVNKDDFLYLFFAVKGLTQQDVADRMGLSLSTVSSRYAALYDALGIKGKKDLLALWESTMKPNRIEDEGSAE